MAQLASRDSADSALFAWMVVRDPPCPVLSRLQQVSGFRVAHFPDDDMVGTVTVNGARA